MVSPAMYRLQMTAGAVLHWDKEAIAPPQTSASPRNISARGTGMTMSAVMGKRKLKKLLLTNSLTIA